MTRLNNKKSKRKVGGVRETLKRLKRKFTQKNPLNNQHYNVNTVELGKTSDTISIHLKKILKRVLHPPDADGAPKTVDPGKVEFLLLTKDHLLFDNTPYESLPDYIAGNELNWDLWESWEFLFKNSTYTMPDGFNRSDRKLSKTHDSDLHKLFTDKTREKNVAYNHFKLRLDHVTRLYTDTLKTKITNPITDIKYAEKKSIDWGDKLFFIGDIHSAFHSLAYILFKLRKKDIFDKTMILKEKHYIVFTGDFVDYGSYGLETLWCILTLKFNNPNNVIIINGNHEDIDQYTLRDRGGSSLIEEIETQVGTLKQNVINFLSLLPMVVFLKKPNGQFYQTNHGSFCEIFAGYKYWMLPDGGTEMGFDPKSNLHTFLNADEENITVFPSLTESEKKIWSLRGWPEPQQPKVGDSFMWGDFKYIPNYKAPRPFERTMTKTSRRQEYSADFTRKYCEEYNILSIISGHQDDVSIGIIPNRVIETINSPGINRNHEIILRDETPTHKLKWYPADKTITYNHIDENILDDKPYEFKLKPFTEVVAIILSTATTMIKRCLFHSFGELQIEEVEVDNEYILVQNAGRKKRKTRKKRNKPSRKKRHTRKRHKRLR